MDYLIVITLVILLIAINGFYVAAEFSTVSAQRARLAQLADSGNTGAQRMLAIIENPHQLDAYIAACQLGITLSSLILGFYGQSNIGLWLEPYLIQLGINFGENIQLLARSLSAATILITLTILQVVLGELMPKNVALLYPEQLAIYTAAPMQWSLFLFQPLIWVFNGSGQLLLRLLHSAPVAEHTHIHSPEEIVLMVEESSAGGLLDQEERRLLVNTLQLRHTSARKAMIPRNHMIAAPIDRPCHELFALLAASPYSRLPIYEETIDKIIGIVHLKDLMLLYYQTVDNPTQSPPALQPILHQAQFVPDSLLIEDVMVLLQSTRTNVAIVIDEYGGTAGMITFEDLVEEIIGEFQDEFDKEDPALVLQDDQRMRVRGEVQIDDLNELLGLYLPTQTVDTVGGLVASVLGRIPLIGEEVIIGDIVLQVEKMDQNRVSEVSLLLSPAQMELLETNTQ
ncbi:MAG: HlyC/CorC family transporter [Caldilineaceae bacterium]|nr:HlyC/CorC family transporter [Caldilineaceae bacterium]